MMPPPRLSHPLLFELLSGAVPDIYAIYAGLRRTGALVRDAAGVSLLARHTDIAKAIADPRFAFIGRQAFPLATPALRARMEKSGLLELLMFRHGEAHRQSRRALAALFSTTALERVHAAVAAEAVTLLGRWEADDTDDFIAAVIAPLPLRALAALFDFEERELSALLSRSRRLAAWLAAAVMEDAALTEAVDEFEQGLAWLQHHSAQMSLGSLRQSVPADARRGVYAELLVLLVTGHDTSEAMLGNAVAALVADPAACAGLAANPALTAQAVDELIRYDSPGQVVFRHALETVEIGGYTIAKGEFVALLLGSGNRDESVYARPDRLDFERPRLRPLAFGAGPHACIGAALARIQLTAFLEAARPCLTRLAWAGPAAHAHQHGLLRRHAHLPLRAVSAGATR